MSFQNRTVLITGGTSGIGKATAHAFLCRGANVVLAARDAGRGETAVRELEAEVRKIPAPAKLASGLLGSGPVGTPGSRSTQRTHVPPRVLFMPCDVTVPEDCRRTVERTLEAFEGLDVLVNNAGVIVRERTVVDTSTREWDLTFDVNVRGTFLMCREAIPALRNAAEPSEGSTARVRRSTTAIVNNASYLGLVGGRGIAAYAAAKGAVINLTRAMALDHAPDGIRVNCIAPGSVETPMLHKEWEELGGEAQVRRRFEEKHPLGRISQAEEIARAILFLASEDASFITGACLPVDGGITAT